VSLYQVPVPNTSIEYRYRVRTSRRTEALAAVRGNSWQYRYSCTRYRYLVRPFGRAADDSPESCSSARSASGEACSDGTPRTRESARYVVQGTSTEYIGIGTAVNPCLPRGQHSVRRLRRTRYRYSPAYKYLVPGRRRDAKNPLNTAAARFLDSLRSLGIFKGSDSLLLLMLQESDPLIARSLTP
jgi:hypothetical protein